MVETTPGALVLVALLLCRLRAWLLSTVAREAPEGSAFPWKIVRWVVFVSVFGAFLFAIGWYVGCLRQSEGPIDVLSRTAARGRSIPLVATTNSVTRSRAEHAE